MTTLLQRAFDAATLLSPAEQDLLALRVLAELAENDFDNAIAASSPKLVTLAAAALAEHRAGGVECDHAARAPLARHG